MVEGQIAIEEYQDREHGTYLGSQEDIFGS